MEVKLVLDRPRLVETFSANTTFAKIAEYVEGANIYLTKIGEMSLWYSGHSYDVWMMLHKDVTDPHACLCAVAAKIAKALNS